MLRQDTSKQKRQIALNIQTTGYEASKGDMITEIAAIEYIDGVKTGNAVISLVNPEGRRIDPGAVKCNKITKAMLEDAPTFYDIASDVLDFIQNDDLIVHNAIYVTTFFDTLMNTRREQAAERKQTLLDTLEDMKKNVDVTTKKYDSLCQKFEDETQRCAQDEDMLKILMARKAELLQQLHDITDKKQKAECKLELQTCSSQITDCQNAIECTKMLMADLEYQMDDAEIELAEREAELTDCQKDLTDCDKIANTEWTTLCADRDVIDVMDMHQKVYPRREGYSHKLNDICAQYDIDTSVDHTAANRAMLTMNAFQKLNPEYMKKREQEKQFAAVKLKNNRNTLFGGVASKPKNAEQLEEVTQKKSAKK